MDAQADLRLCCLHYGIRQVFSLRGSFLVRMENYSQTYEPLHDKTNKMACAPSEDSDQLRHPPSLISLRCLHEKGLVPKLPKKCTAKTLIRLGRSFCWFCHAAAHMLRQKSEYNLSPLWPHHNKSQDNIYTGFIVDVYLCCTCLVIILCRIILLSSPLTAYCDGITE